MSDFKKYSSIDNSYQGKAVIHWLRNFPELKDVVFVLREKLDGANIQFYFEPKKVMKVGKRTSFLTEGTSFFGIWALIPKYETLFTKFQEYAESNNQSIRVFGEIFGPGINGRVDYGDDKQFRIFDIYIDEVLLCQYDLEKFLKNLDTQDMLAPEVTVVTGLEKALEVSPEFVSKILNKEDNFAEGFVIQSYHKVYRLTSGERFIFKKKGDKFKERENNGAKIKTKKELHPNIIRLVGLFSEYINENRILSIFSKHGTIESSKQIGDYIRLVLTDAKEDFLKDNPELDLDKNTAKIVFNTGKTIVDLLKKHL